ncbi:MAG: histidine ammonia-lyase, partial [Parachlamydiaceae bacterium]|nr:histidine ammonia-lyase [Parachlamydiaceae bacterium]
MTKVSELKPLILDGESLTLAQAEKIAFGHPIKLAKNVKSKMKKSRDLIQKLAHGSVPIYGVNTGFGFLANTCIKPTELKKLQSNLIKSHASGYGRPLSIPETRLAIALRINVLIKGYTGVRYELCEALLHLLEAEIYPIIPEYGSVGASGDLIPLAHLALPLLGFGNVQTKVGITTAKNALKKAGLKPFELAEKEGLSLINGTQIMLSVGGLALISALNILNQADRIAALSFEGLLGHTDALHPEVHHLRGQIGQIESATQLRKELEGSSLYDPDAKHIHIQDPYSLRCIPQIHGPSRDSISHASQIISRELNSLTDNPLVFADEGIVVSGGNFHGQALAMAFDIASIAISEIGNVSERRLDLLLNPRMNGLTAFLSPHPGINSGYMTLQYLSASLVNENKLLANPSCTDSIPGNANIEDFVSMGMTSARKFKKIVENVKVILTAEMLAATQAIDLRKPKTLGKGTSATYRTVRISIPMLIEDRIIQNDLEVG